MLSSTGIHCHATRYIYIFFNLDQAVFFLIFRPHLNSACAMFRVKIVNLHLQNNVRQIYIWTVRLASVGLAQALPKKEHCLVKVSIRLYYSLELYFWVLIQSFTFIILRYKFCYPWRPVAVLEELASQHRNKKLLKIGDNPETRDRVWHAAETSEQRSEKAKGERLC